MRYGLFLVCFFLACSSLPTAAKSSLYEVLTEQETGGGSIQFYELISEVPEMRLLLNDPHLQNKVKQTDVNKCNFLVLHLGEKRTGGYKIKIDQVREEADQIVVKVKEISPATNSRVTMAITYPYAVIKINSKKKIVIE